MRCPEAAQSAMPDAAGGAGCEVFARFLLFQRLASFSKLLLGFAAASAKFASAPLATRKWLNPTPVSFSFVR